MWLLLVSHTVRKRKGSRRRATEGLRVYFLSHANLKKNSYNWHALPLDYHYLSHFWVAYGWARNVADKDKAASYVPSIYFYFGGGAMRSHTMVIWLLLSKTLNDVDIITAKLRSAEEEKLTSATATCTM